MTDTFYGKRFSLTPPFEANNRGVLRRLYILFSSGDIIGWSIKSGVTIPAPDVLTGDNGFVITNGQVDIAFGHGSAVGGVNIVGGALSGTEMCVGMDPSGGITNITSAGWSVGSRWSGWACGSINLTMSQTATKFKASWGPDWIFLRFPTKDPYNGYTQGIYVGSYNMIASRGSNEMENWCIFGGSFSKWFVVESYNNSGAYESDISGTWDSCIPKSIYGYSSNALSNGTSFKVTYLPIFAKIGTSYSSQMPVIGFLKGLLVGQYGTIGKAWRDNSGNLIAYNFGAFTYTNTLLALDDQGDPE